MNESKGKSKKTELAYAAGQITEVGLAQYFSLFVFTFYFFVVGLNIFYIATAFIIWAFWNALNDPLIGALSDRTQSKHGRRKPWIIAGLIPVLFIMVFTFTPPMGSQLIIFIYMLIIILLYETFFSMYGVNWLSLLPEMYEDLEERSRVMQYVLVGVFISMVVAVMLPAVFIPDFNDPQYRGNYVLAAIFMAIFLGFWGFVFIKWGLKEKIEFSKDAEAAPSVLDSFKFSLKNKSFRIYAVANFFAWYVLGMIAVFPAYVAFVIGVSDTALIGLVLVVMLIFMALFGPVWKKITLKVGVRKAMIYSFLIWGFSQIPYLFIIDYPSMLIVSVFSGIGLSGVSYLQRIIMAVICDEDELETGVRREAGFWGINYFINRLSTIAVFLSIGLVFASVDWLIYGGEASVTPEMIFGLRLLRGLFTFVGLMIGVVFMILFPITKEVNEQIAQDARKLHVEKKARVSG